MSDTASESTCTACGEPVDPVHSLPVDTTGRIVHNGYTGEWAGVPACAGCYAVHAAGGPDALDAHVKATADLRATLQRTRAAADALARAVSTLTEELGT